MTYKLSQQAGHDLRDITRYTIEHWSEAQTRAYLQKLYDAFDKLAVRPSLGRKRKDIPEPYLVYAVGSHMIIYRYNDAKARVEILNILHPAMDITKRLRQALENP